MNFTRATSLEVTKPSIIEINTLGRILPTGTGIYVTAIQGEPWADTVNTCQAISNLGLVPVPHIIVRSCRSLDEVVERIFETGASNILLLGGDIPLPRGSIDSTQQVIHSGKLQGLVEQVGISGFPEGHPHLPPGTDIPLMEAKIEALRQQGLKVEVVTQFTLSAPPVIQWVGKVRAAGITTPIRMGMSGPVGLRKLLAYARRCGVNAAAQGLFGGQATQLLQTLAHKPEDMIEGLKQGLGSNHNPLGLHIFSFGGVVDTAEWMKKNLLA